MADIIRLLPDSVANQIAAGEVIQRPASAVKELLENSLDAGSTRIQLIVKDAGKTLLQVIDNGCGMSEMDARMSFERHATSKIKSADELFQIRTKGFRGEALASIAAIAQVELKSRLTEVEIGTRVLIEGTEVQLQEPCANPAGTSIAIKNLFYNVPARRNFLKSDAVEMRHIVEEFERIALAHYKVHFIMHHNGNEIFNLPPAPLRQRIVNTFGGKYNERLVPVEEDTDIVRVAGFISKPEFARKTRGEQFFFVNQRFIKSAYLHHAISNAFRELISTDSHPSYFLFLDVDPAMVDVNIHPTKTEVKFQDEKAIYAIIRSSVQRSLGRYNISPSLDFEQETSFNVQPLKPGDRINPPQITVNPDYNPFEGAKTSQKTSFPTSSPNRPLRPNQNWESLYEIAATKPKTENESLFNSGSDSERAERTTRPAVMQLQSRYIVTTIRSGLVVIDQERAHERILFEKAMRNLANQKASSQQLIFPETVEMSPSDYELFHELLPKLNQLGFDIEEFGKNTALLRGLPVSSPKSNGKALIEKMLEDYKHFQTDLKTDELTRLARAWARNVRIQGGTTLAIPEMNNLIDELFACETPYYSPGGKPTIVTFTPEELIKKFDH